MKPLSHRERAMLALNHHEADRVPLDFGSTIATTMIVPAYERLKNHLGLKHETKFLAKRGRTVIPDEAVLRRFDVDFRPLVLGDFRGGGAKEIDPDTMFDVWGTTWKKAPDGHFINVGGPFQNRDPDLGLIESFAWPDPADPGLYEGLRERADFLRNHTDYAVILNLPVGIMHQCEFMRGFAPFLMDLVENPEFACLMMDRVADVWTGMARRAVEAVGDRVDVVAWGDDVAMQQAPLMSPATYHTLIKPRHRRMVESIKSGCGAKVQYHSCGAVTPLLNDLIDIGVDALNPVQVSARNMDPGQLKIEYGERLSFWGGIDTQHVLPSGTVEEVRAEVRRIIDALGKGGGYVLASVHNIQAEVPPENVVAMFDEAKTYGVYRHG
jgi:uroporphyrinogen decarboxylase